MKKIFLLSILLSACSFNNNSNYWTSNMKKEVLNFNKQYTFDEFKIIFKKYNENKEYPNIN